MDIRQQVQHEALRLGFDTIRVARWDAVLDQQPRLLKWLGHGFAGDMAYLDRRPADRCNPRSLLPDCNSVICLALGYYIPDEDWPRPGRAMVSRYAWGDDYHEVLKEKLKALGDSISVLSPGHSWKPTVDTSPVLEKAFAAASGLGWQGKHSLVINPELGSYFFIGLLLTSLKLEPDTALRDGCSGCKACLDVCPTGALVAPRVLAANKCVSYLTTECKEPPPPGTDLKGWLYGCDLCQQACPYNEAPRPANEPRFAARDGIRDLGARELLEMDEEQFAQRFSGTVIKRRKLWRMQEQARRMVEAGARVDG